MLIDPSDPLGRTFEKVRESEIQWEEMKYQCTRVYRWKMKLQDLGFIGLIVFVAYRLTS